ncbi:MAG: CDGSH iron-sulfur domain-containing protein [Candidatus Marinimicrobia bacterium]|nr:CDGSH iron-sulfur domain-containing protein [Candidatus Neomarinimicrobiota bacterium]
MTEPQIAQKMPYVQKAEAGKTYAWCACGLSNNQPFCDGSHKATDISPIIVKQDEDKNVAWCGCKQTGTKPYCDGTHSKL